MSATTAEGRTKLTPNRLEIGQAVPPRGRKRGGARNWLLLLVAFGFVVGGGGAGYLAWSASRVDDASSQAITRLVEKSDLVVSIFEDGNLESANNIELKCEVEGTSTTILEIVPDGRQVKKGDELIKLDSSSIEDSIGQQEITLADANAAKISAEEDWSAATIAVEEYKEGIYKQELKQMKADISQAQQDLSSAKNSLMFVKKMHRQGYRTTLELESAKSLVLQSELNLEVAMTKVTVLETLTSKKTLKELESKRDSFEAKMKGQQISYNLQLKKLKKLEGNLAKCVITAPQDGMVVYANDMSPMRAMSGQGVTIEEGAAVRQFQAIIRLPDLSKMQVKTLVHESKIDLLRVGMRAKITIQDRDYQGTVHQVATQPEPGGWFGGNVKEYATIVKIDGRPEGLKPGMTAEVKILVTEKKDVLSVPVQAIVEQGKKFHVWVKSSPKPEKRTVLLGVSNDTFIEIKDGLVAGDLVLLNPRAVVPEAREDVPQEEAVDVSKEFGATAGTVQMAEGDSPKPPVKNDPSLEPAQPAAGADAGRPEAETAGGAPAASGTSDGGAAGGVKQPTFKELDKNSDGKLTKEELPEFARQGFETMDADKDGFVDEKEHKTAAEKFAQGGGQGKAGSGGGQVKLPTFKDLDKDADGSLTEEEMPEPMRPAFATWDADSDGTLTRKEFNDAMEQVKKYLKGRGTGQGGGGPPGGAPPQ